MLNKLILASAVWLAASAGLHAGDAIGFRETTVIGEPLRQIHISVWFPTDSDAGTQTIGDNPAFQGEEVVRYAAPDQEQHPLVVLSHGYRGSWRNLNWLAARLARQGYIVAAPDHPGTTTFDQNPRLAAMSGLRPRDVSIAIDTLLDDASFAGRVDPQRIAVVGHSLGGWTTIALAGGRFDSRLFAEDCKADPQRRSCTTAPELGLDQPDVEQDLGDPRLRAFVSLDLGLARGFTPESLGAIRAPVLVLAAGTDISDLPADMESGYVARHLPPETSDYVVIADATHFSFMQKCKPGAEAVIEADAPGESYVCRDGGERSRAELHDEIWQRIDEFLAGAL